VHGPICKGLAQSLQGGRDLWAVAAGRAAVGDQSAWPCNAFEATLADENEHAAASCMRLVPCEALAELPTKRTSIVRSRQGVACGVKNQWDTVDPIWHAGQALWKLARARHRFCTTAAGATCFVRHAQLCLAIHHQTE
jgi:hypothetical protein